MTRIMNVLPVKRHMNFTANMGMNQKISLCDIISSQSNYNLFAALPHILRF